MKVVLIVKRQPRYLAQYLVLGALCALMGLPTSAVAEEITLNGAINIAGRQRMLTERMTRAYCQIGLNARRAEAQDQLDKSVQLFEKQLASLRRFTATPEVESALAEVEARWVRFKTVVTKNYSRDGVTQLIEISEELLQAGHLVVLELEGLSGKSAGTPVNVSNRQLMLSQRLAKLYMLRQLGFRQPIVQEGLDQARSEFLGAHSELRNAARSSPDAGKHLANVSIQWNLLDHSLKAGGQDLSEFVVLTSEKILGEMEIAAELFERL